MNIVSIFVKPATEKCHLWAAQYEQDVDSKGRPLDIFRKLFRLWTNTEYLLAFFKEHEQDLLTGYKGMSIDQAIETVEDEAYAFEAELKVMEKNGDSFSDVFHQLHKNEFVLKKENELLRKARPVGHNTMLRLYAVELEGGCYVISGGAIKLRDKMDNTYLKGELSRVNMVRDYLEQQGIISVEGLL